MYRRVEVDPVTLNVLGGAFNAIASDMAQVLYRMAYSSIIRESEDIGAGIYDTDARELCESASTPMHVGSIPGYLRGIMKVLGDDIDDGDVILHNHPYFGGSHSPDVCVAIPIFYEGKLIAFAANTAHWIDTGGAYPGLNVDVVDVWAEAKLLKAIKIDEKGVRNKQVERFLFDNVRTPTNDRGDMEAQIASCRVGRERFLGLIERYGLDVVMSAADHWMDYAERMLRAEIEKVPDGTYHSEGWLDDDGKNRDVHLKVSVDVTIEGSDITIDLSNSSPQVATSYNVPFDGSTLVAAHYIVRTIFLDEATTGKYVPQNEGIFRPITVIAPEGNIFNPRFPASCTSRFMQCQRMADCVILALADVIPERVTAGNSAHAYAIVYSGYVPERQQYWVNLEVSEGAYGAMLGKDGTDAVDNLIANTRNNPIEDLDWHYPMRNLRYELRPDPPAPGKWRGGLSIIRENQFLGEGFVSIESDRHYEKPVGLFGGQPGMTGALTLNPGTEREEKWYSKITGARVAPGDILRIESPCGGGYGDALERDPEAVLKDFLDELFDAEHAQQYYGVVIDEDMLVVDTSATSRLRSER
ncbi:MAG: hydantoinase B/oxoprolinase family protein [Thermoleophilia bacterium]|nr:hydantoinase B/oxoprolinase family protein [Thermoleophilia bacterium]